MTVAVLIDGVQEPQPDGTQSWRPRSAEELAQLRALVASAVGFDEARGDVITLQSLRFEPVAALGTEARSGWFANPALDAMTLLRWAFLLVVLAVFILFVLRPLLRAARADTASQRLALDGPALPEDGFERFEGGAAQLQASSDEREDPIARLRRLIEERQEDSTQLLRHWMEDRKEPS